MNQAAPQRSRPGEIRRQAFDDEVEVAMGLRFIDRVQVKASLARSSVAILRDDRPAFRSTLQQREMLPFEPVLYVVEREGQ